MRKKQYFFIKILTKKENDDTILSPNFHKGVLKMKEYKILSQKDKWFSGKFDPQKLEAAINSYAQQGWIVKAAFTAEIPGFMSSTREEAIIILERDI